MKKVKERLALFMCVCLLFSSIPSNCFAENLINNESVEENIVVLEDNISSESEIELSEDNESVDDFEEIVSDAESIEENLDVVNNMEEEPEEDFVSSNIEDNVNDMSIPNDINEGKDRIEEFEEENSNVENNLDDIATQSDIDIDDDEDDIEEKSVLKNFGSKMLFSSYVGKTFSTDDFLFDKSVLNGKTNLFIENTSPRGYVIATMSDGSDTGLYEDGNDIIIYIDMLAGDSLTYGGTYAFRELNPIKKISGLSNIDMTGITSLSKMFENSSDLNDVDFTGFDTSNVTDMSYMFSRSGINKYDIDTSSVENMSHMFDHCGFTSIDLSSFITSNVTDMSYLFYNCLNLRSVDVSNFDTKKVTNMTYMFGVDPSDMFATLGMRSLKSLDVTSFNTINVTNMSRMFEGCRVTETIYVSKNNFIIQNTDQRGLFLDGLAPTLARGNDGYLHRVADAPEECVLYYNTYIQDGNGGSRSVQMLNWGTIQNAQSVLAGATLSEPTGFVIREGYEFIGWYKDIKYADKWDFEKDTVSGKEITLYARWGLRARYDIGSSATWIKTPQNLYPLTESYATFTLPKNEDINCPGKKLIGWKCDSNYYTEYIHNPGSEKKLFEHSVFIAVWESDNTTTTTTSEKTTYSSSSSDSSGDGGSGSGPLKASTLTQGQQPSKQPTPVKQVQVNNSSNTAPVVQSQNATWSLDPVTNTFKLEIKDALGKSVKVQNGFCKLANVEKQIINNQVVDVPVESLYCFDANGNMCTGWVQTADKGWYYFDTNQATFGQGAKNSWKEVDGKFYYFDNDGKMLSNTITPDGKQVNENGELVTAYNDATPTI